METIQINIKDKILNRVGISAIKKRFEKELEYLYYEDIAENIQKKIEESGINNEKELELARQRTWNEYKKDFLKDIIIYNAKNQINSYRDLTGF